MTGPRLAELLTAALELDDLGVFAPGDEGADEIARWIEAAREDEDRP